MSNPRDTSDVQIPNAVQVQVGPIVATYLELPAERAPLGSHVTITRNGELAPFVTGELPAGATVLFVTKDNADILRHMIAGALQKARQAGYGASGIAGG